MIWLPLIVNVLLGTLIPSFVLWIIGKKVEYDFPFWKLLIITSSAALVKQIPVAGIWISLPVYYGLFCALTGIDYIEALWMSFLSFLVYAAVGFILLMYAGSLYADFRESTPDSELVAENTDPSLVQPIPPPEPEQPDLQAPIEPKPEAEAPDWLKQKYIVNGIAKSGGEKRAIINGKVAIEGEILEPDVQILSIELDQVIIQAKNECYTLKIHAHLP